MACFFEEHDRDLFAATAVADFGRGSMVVQLLTCIRGLLLVPEGQMILAQQFIAGKGSLCWMSAVGTAEDPSQFHRSGSFSRPSGTELSDSCNPSNKLLGYGRFVPPGQREEASRTS